jgi:NAD+ kinase
MGAGGPILHPEMEAFILNPICPFTLSNRPLVVPSAEDIELELERANRTEAVLTVDGQQPWRLESGDRITFRTLPQKSLIIRSDRRNFYEVLRSKLNWSGEPNA